MAAITMLPPPGGSSYQVNVCNSDSVLVRRVIDFTELGSAKGSTLAAADTANFITINAGDFVTRVWVRQLVAGTSSSTVSIGDTAVGATAWHNALATDGAAQTFTAANGANVTAGKFYSSADALKLTLGATPPLTGRIEVTAEVYKFGTSTVK